MKCRTQQKTEQSNCGSGKGSDKADHEGRRNSLDIDALRSLDIDALRTKLKMSPDQVADFLMLSHNAQLAFLSENAALLGLSLACRLDGK